MFMHHIYEAGLQSGLSQAKQPTLDSVQAHYSERLQLLKYMHKVFSIDVVARLGDAKNPTNPPADGAQAWAFSRMEAKRALLDDHFSFIFPNGYYKEAGPVGRVRHIEHCWWWSTIEGKSDELAFKVKSSHSDKIFWIPEAEIIQHLVQEIAAAEFAIDATKGIK